MRDLSILLNRSEPYIGDAIRPLVTSGQVQFLYPDQPKHPRQKYIEASQAVVEPSPPPSPPPPIEPVAAPPRLRDPVPTRTSDPGAAAHRPSPRAPVEPIGGWGGPLVSVAAALTIGIAFALAGIDRWVLYATGLALAFAVALVLTRSRQHALYLERVHARGAPAKTHEMVLFFLIKAPFTFAEIALAVLGMSLLR